MKNPVKEERMLKLLACVCQTPGQSFIEICNALHINTTTARPARETLEYRELIRMQKELTGRGLPKLLYPTEKGFELLEQARALTEGEKKTSGHKEPTQETIVRCAHHWIIEPCVGPVSKGKCKNCHDVREFKNSTEPPSNPAAYPGL